MEIKDLELSENDFKLIVDGLEALPHRSMAGEMISMMLEGTISDRNPEAMERIKRERVQKELKEKATKEQMAEDIKILQGKLLMFKRWLMQEGALKQTNEILNR